MTKRRLNEFVISDKGVEAKCVRVRRTKEKRQTMTRKQRKRERESEKKGEV